MANIIGTIAKDLDKIPDIEECHIKCGTSICGDAVDERWRCEDCEGEILGICLHLDQKMKHSVWEIVDEMCTDCGKCEW